MYFIGCGGWADGKCPFMPPGCLVVMLAIAICRLHTAFTTGPGLSARFLWLVSLMVTNCDSVFCELCILAVVVIIVEHLLLTLAVANNPSTQPGWLWWVEVVTQTGFLCICNVFCRALPAALWSTHMRWCRLLENWDTPCRSTSAQNFAMKHWHTTTTMFVTEELTLCVSLLDSSCHNCADS